MTTHTQHDGAHEGCDLDVAHEHDIRTSQASIPMGAADRLFFGGVAAGDVVEAELTHQAPDAMFLERVSFYWLQVGVAFGRAHPYGTADDLDLYLRGATLRKPTERICARVDIADLPPDQFQPDPRHDRVDERPADDLSSVSQDDDSDRYDGHGDVADARRRAVARILCDAAEQIEDGQDVGRLLDPSGRPVGTFRIQQD